MANKKTELDYHILGLILMIIFTSLWTTLSEYFFNKSDFRIVGIIFGLVIIYFIYTLVKFNKSKIGLPEITLEMKHKKSKWFYTMFALEGIAIFVVQIILVNVGKANLILCSTALIIGLHFIPFAKLFNRKFDYYIGVWTSIIAIVGLVIITTNQLDYKAVNAFVCLGCALSTIMYGIEIAKAGNSYIARNQK